MSPPPPPRWARALLGRLLPADEVATVLGDLDEGFALRARERGGRLAAAGTAARRATRVDPMVVLRTE